MKNTPSDPTTPSNASTSVASTAAATAVMMLLPTVPPTAGPSPDPEVDAWAEKINHSVANGIEWLISAGVHLKLAKAALDHGSWESMFNSGKVTMGLRSAEMLMRIAKHPALAKAKHIAQLPPTLTALYALSGASEEAVTGGIKSGDINPEMTASQAKAFVKAQNPNPAPEKPATSFDADARRTRIQQVVQREVSKWPDDARTQLADLLEQMAKDIRASVNPTQQP